MARRITRKDGADAVAMLDEERTARSTRARSKQTKPTPKVSKAQLVRDQFGKGASLTEAAMATGVDPAYVWDLAAIWEKKTGKRVPRNGRTAGTEKATVAK